MPTTSFADFTGGVRSIGSRTDSAGTAVDDLTFEEDKLINSILTEGYLTDGAFEVSADSPASMDVIVGSGSAMVDRYVVEGDDAGQHPYIVQLKDANITVTLDASDASNPRIDELWLVVADASWDAGSVSLPRIGYRKGDAAADPSAPGADSSWKAAVKLATITVGAAVTSITSGNIADHRAAASLDAPLPGTWEVRGSTEVASDLSPSGALATVALTIPAGWGGWDIEGYATFAVEAASDGAAGGQESFSIRIDGTEQQAVAMSATNSDGTTNGMRIPASVGGYASGTSTGTVNVDLYASNVDSTVIDVYDMYMYARAIRTS